MVYNLDCRYDARQSFYGKAKVEQEEKDNLIINNLYSYGVLVAQRITNIDTMKTTYKYLGKYSQTTTRHQKEFFKQNGLTDNEIKKLFKEGTLEINE